MPIGSQWLASAGAAEFDPETIGNSIWLDGSADYMGRQNGSPFADGKKAIFSFWIQRCKCGTQQAIFGSVAGSGFILQISAADQFWIYANDGSAQYTTNRKFRDTAWYHFIVSFDTNEATALDRIKLWVNGVPDTDWGYSDTLAEDDDDFGISAAQTSTSVMRLGAYNNGSANYYYWYGYIAQMCMLESKSIQNGDFAVSDFLDTFTLGTNGSQFIPKADSAIAALANTAGGNSFCLDFAASADLGNDISSNNQDWSPTSMAAANQSVNTPSLTYPILNHLTNRGNVTLLAGNTQVTYLTSVTAMGTLAIPDGSWYWEVKYVGGSGSGSAPGICTFDYNTAAELGYNSPSSPASADTRGIYRNNGSKGYGVSSSFNLTSYGSGQATDTYNGIAVTKSGTSWKIWFSESGTWPISGNPATGANPAYDWTSVYDYTFAIGNWSTANQTVSMVMVPADWQATVPEGFLSLASNNLPTPDYQGVDYFKPLLYAGNGTAIGSGGKAVTGTGFQPDLVWIKNRTAADDNALYDAVRGVTKQIESNTTTAETTEAEGLTAFGSDGFTVGNLDQVNTSSENFVAWQWLGANGTSTNEVGTLTSTVSVSASNHFSIVSYTGSGANTTVGHGLSAAPEMVIVRELPGGDDWNVYTATGTGSGSVRLDADTAFVADATLWNSTAPSSTVISLGTSNETNQSSTAMIAYCFRSIPGVCKVGKYQGTGHEDGPVVNCGFAANFLLIKNLDGADDWVIWDRARNLSNVSNTVLYPSTADAGSSGATRAIDLLSNGFKLRTSASLPNGSGEDYIYLAMASLGGKGTLPPIYGQ